MNSLLNFIFGKKCFHCEVRGYVVFDFYHNLYWCKFCFERQETFLEDYEILSEI